DQRLGGVEVGVGEVEHLLALVGDGHAGRGDVAFAGVQVLTRLDALERGVDDRLGHAQLLGDQVDQGDVEADDLAGGVLGLERRGGAGGGGRGGPRLYPGT